MIMSTVPDQVASCPVVVTLKMSSLAYGLDARDTLDY